MKRLLSLILALVVCFGFGITALADGDEQANQDMSQPRLMVTDYKVEGGSISPSKEKNLTIRLRNYSKAKSLHNVKLSLVDESGEIEAKGMPNVYVDKIRAGSDYVWTLKIKASKIAQVGEHKLSVTSEYEDRYYNAYSGSDIIGVNVVQTVGIDYSGAMLPAKLFVDDTTSLDITILNTGKSNIRNCKVEFFIDRLESGGAVFVGEIPAGEQGTANANLRVGKELGDIEGEIVFTYEDELGKQYKEQVSVSSSIIEKPVEKAADNEKKSKHPLWWAFLLGGAMLGAAVGASIPVCIYKSRKRREDDLRL